MILFGTACATYAFGYLMFFGLVCHPSRIACDLANAYCDSLIRTMSHKTIWRMSVDRICLFICLFVCLCVCLFACSFFSFPWLFICLYVYFICLCFCVCSTCKWSHSDGLELSAFSRPIYHTMLEVMLFLARLTLFHRTMIFRCACRADICIVCRRSHDRTLSTQ